MISKIFAFAALGTAAIGALALTGGTAALPFIGGLGALELGMIGIGTGLLPFLHFSKEKSGPSQFFSLFSMAGGIASSALAVAAAPLLPYALIGTGLASAAASLTRQNEDATPKSAQKLALKLS